MVMVRRLRPSGAIAQEALWRSQGPILSHFDRIHISQSKRQVQVHVRQRVNGPYLESVLTFGLLLMKIVWGAFEAQVVIAGQNKHVFRPIMTLVTTDLLDFFHFNAVWLSDTLMAFRVGPWVQPSVISKTVSLLVSHICFFDSIKNLDIRRLIIIWTY